MDHHCALNEHGAGFLCTVGFGHVCDAEKPAEAGPSAATRASGPVADIIPEAVTYREVLEFDVRYAELYLWAVDQPPQHRDVIVELIATAMACSQENAA